MKQLLYIPALAVFTSVTGFGQQLWFNNFNIADTDSMTGLIGSGSGLFTDLNDTEVNSSSTFDSAIVNGALRFEHISQPASGPTGYVHGGFIITNLSAPAGVIAVQFDLDINSDQQEPVAEADLGELRFSNGVYLGSFPSPIGAAPPNNQNSGTSAVSVYSWFVLQWVPLGGGATQISAIAVAPNTGTDVGSFPTQFFSGPVTVTWVNNSSGSAYNYTGPDGQPESVANGTYDLWFDDTLLWNDFVLNDPTIGATSFGVRQQRTSALGTLIFDNLEIRADAEFGGGEPPVSPWDALLIEGSTTIADTGSIMGLINVSQAPEIYSYALDAWMHIEDEWVGEEFITAFVYPDGTNPGETTNEWGGYPLTEAGFVDTTTWLGQLYIQDSWVFNYGSYGYIYLPEAWVDAGVANQGGSWAMFPR